MRRKHLGRLQPVRGLKTVLNIAMISLLASNVGRFHRSLLLASVKKDSSAEDAADAPMMLPRPEPGRTGDDHHPFRVPPGYPFLVPSDFVPLSTDGAPPAILYADAEGSARTLLEEAQTPRSVPDDGIDPTIEGARCERYDLKYSGRRERRRVFYGSAINDDSWHIVAITALENYGIFHSVALVESNRTHMNNPRNVRFGPGSENLALLRNGLWGPNTPVTVDLFVNEVGSHQPGWHPAGYGMEGLMRGRILKRWKENGMRPDDIGYLADLDEFFSRDYLRAMQICDVRQMDAHQNCKNAKLGGHTVIFEGGPQCKSSKIILHPNLIIGACIEGIGNSTLHPKPERGWRGTGWASDGWTSGSGFRKLPKNSTHFPLFNAPDLRRLAGRTYDGKDFRYNGFHLHNSFRISMF